jgi:hypothetical protein
MLIRTSFVVGYALFSASAFAQDVVERPIAPPIQPSIAMPQLQSMTPAPAIQVPPPPPPVEQPREPDRPTYCDTHKDDKKNCPD